MIANHSLRECNTLKLDVNAQWFSAPTTLAELTAQIAEARQQQLPITLLGEGSNLVLADDIPGCVIQPALQGKTILADNGKQVEIAVSAGEHFDDVVAWSLEQGLQGLENLSLIPGSAGAAPFQNIGAYGVELADRLIWLEAVELATGKLIRFTHADCHFGYRDSFFKTVAPTQFVITRLGLLLHKQTDNPALMLDYADLAQQFAALPKAQQNATGLRHIVCETRQSKLPDPAVLPNAGSFFKNPIVEKSLADALRQQWPTLPAHELSDGNVKLAAGWLIEQTGFKGKRDGKVGMHERQALVLVNYSDASGQEVLEFARQVRDVVANKFGVTLEQEPVVLPASLPFH